MKSNILKSSFIIIMLLAVSCEDDFLERQPLDSPSAETFWTSAVNAEFWVNNLYNGLATTDDAQFEAFSDNAFGRAALGANRIANGTFEPIDPNVNRYWNFRKIRESLEFFEFIGQVPNISQAKLDELSGQVNFMVAYQYFRLITLYRDVPLVTHPLSIPESDIPKSPKEEVLNYILEHLNLAIEQLPVNWPVNQTGRFTKGAALALKARVLLYNERWAEAAAAAKQVMDLNEYELHPKFEELFLQSFNNQTKEVILARQYAKDVEINTMNRNYAPVSMGGFALILPTAELEKSYEMIDGLTIEESPLFDPMNPFSNRDPRYFATFLYPYSNLNGVVYNPFGSDQRFSITWLYFRKYTGELRARAEWQSYVNWIIFRYADVLLMYAEAKNEESGPDPSVYDVLDKIRMRAGMPRVDRVKYGNQSTLRTFIRNERRVELAGEGLRYFDILRWRIAEETLNVQLKSLYVPGLLPENNIELRVFNPNRHYVWPIPQDAIDRAKNLEQHPEWR
ncbi:RagB/SusD family nutrient uptake outer membrane protein [Cyclobacterium xiamenense]|uniref:RagB/SusD family nutrient uptake outer membrane protein n=1 Tax=Cyclobacterium xiamenense TaxID=1297121 RepID=UPI0035D04BC9